MDRMLRGLVQVAMFILLCGAPGAVEASLIGDSVTCSASVLTCTPATATAGAVPTFDLSGLLSVNVDASFISLGNQQTPDPLILAVAAVTFGDLDSSAGDIVDVSVATVGAIPGIDESDVSFTAHSVTIDLSQSQWEPESSVFISLTFAPAAAVPVPATLLLLASAVVSFGAVRVSRPR
jgi:hypothetical protein